MVSYPSIADTRSRELPLVDGLQVKRELLIASDLPSKLWLVCTPLDVRLVLRTLLPTPRTDGRSGVGSTRAQFFFSATNKRSVLSVFTSPFLDFSNAFLRSNADGDVIVTPAMTKASIDTLIPAFYPRTPAYIRVTVVEAAVEIPGIVDDNTMSDFIKECPAAPRY